MAVRPKLVSLIILFVCICIQSTPVGVLFRRQLFEIFSSHITSLRSSGATSVAVILNPWTAAVTLQKENEKLELSNRTLQSETASCQAASYSARLQNAIDHTPFAYIPHKSLVLSGHKDGVLQNRSVTSQGIWIGVISEIGEHVAKVSLLSDGDIEVAIQYPKFQKNALLRKEGMTYIARFFSRIDVVPGDFLLTLGDGEKIPAGLPVAKILEDRTSPADPYSIVAVELLGNDSQVSRVSLQGVHE